MAESIRVALAQWDFLVGDIPGNADKVIELAQRARQEQQADLVVSRVGTNRFSAGRSAIAAQSPGASGKGPAGYLSGSD